MPAWVLSGKIPVIDWSEQNENLKLTQNNELQSGQSRKISTCLRSVDMP